MALFSNAVSVVRQSMARMLDDLALVTVSSATTSTIVPATLVTGYNEANDYFNKWQAYCYEGTNMGVAYDITDWAASTHTLTYAPTSTACDATSKLELHRIFTAAEYLNAINLAIESVAGRYLIDLIDDTTTTLTESTSNDGVTLYTYEYTLPTTLLYIHRVTLEDYGSGKKLTGTVSGAFTLGETITGGTSGATGILSYGPAGSTYILVREVSGTFAVGETATGTTSAKTCSAITAVADETVGTGKFPESRIVDPRFWRLLKAYSPDLKFDEDVTIYGNLRVRYDGQGSQARVTLDTDNIFLPFDWIVMKAITFMPYSKIEGNNLTNTFKMCEVKTQRAPFCAINANAKAVIE